MAANHPAKKMKIEEISDDKSIKDPFVRVHEHVRELMLQHLTGREALSSMEVSKDWNEIIAGSRKCMSKVTLHFQEKSTKDPSLKEVTALLESNRRYQNMKLSANYVANRRRKLLLLQRFSQSLVELELKLGKNGKLIKNLPENISFPKLQSLKLVTRRNGNRVITKCFQNVLLKKFETDGSELIESSAAEWLKNQSQLKELAVERFNPVVLLGASFKLESLCLQSCTWQADLNTFLLSQADSLVHLELCYLDQQNLKTIFNCLPKLKTFSCCNMFGASNVDLEPNQSLTEFTSVLISPPRNILKSLVNVEILTCSLNQEDEVVWALTNLTKLKKHFVSCNRLTFSAVSAAYRTLKESGALGDREIEINQITV
jgi:hypothetical protein